MRLLHGVGHGPMRFAPPFPFSLPLSLSICSEILSSLLSLILLHGSLLKSKFLACSSDSLQPWHTKFPKLI
ncbi:hypothetical protein L6164_029176 [Bauhinia variegata]|uniref:Uncharacterized protein n=1 Tax=Bauhinia variegata TaxID=167791 RepID=A0ACB9L8X1_BAUVA|nr:hypothetical protein L6164_029176 [Bauhinia variegata]